MAFGDLFTLRKKPQLKLGARTTPVRKAPTGAQSTALIEKSISRFALSADEDVPLPPVNGLPASNCISTQQPSRLA